MSEPLSEERLAEIRRDWSGGVMGASTVFELVAEVERLRAELDAIRSAAHARSEELLIARDDVPIGDPQNRRGQYEYAASELRGLVKAAFSGSPS